MRRMIPTNQLELIENLSKGLLPKTIYTSTIYGPNNYGLSMDNNNDTVINAGRYLSLSFNGEGEGGSFTIDDEDSGVQYIQCYNNLVFLPSLPISNPGVKGALWNDNGVLKISAGE